MSVPRDDDDGLGGIGIAGVVCDVRFLRLSLRFVSELLWYRRAASGNRISTFIRLPLLAPARSVQQEEGAHGTIGEERMHEEGVGDAFAFVGYVLFCDVCYRGVRKERVAPLMSCYVG